MFQIKDQQQTCTIIVSKPLTVWELELEEGVEVLFKLTSIAV